MKYAQFKSYQISISLLVRGSSMASRIAVTNLGAPASRRDSYIHALWSIGFLAPVGTNSKSAHGKFLNANQTLQPQRREAASEGRERRNGGKPHQNATSRKNRSPALARPLALSRPHPRSAGHTHTHALSFPLSPPPPLPSRGQAGDGRRRSRRFEIFAEPPRHRHRPPPPPPLSLPRGVSAAPSTQPPLRSRLLASSSRRRIRSPASESPPPVRWLRGDLG